jgi:hypothetical protein
VKSFSSIILHFQPKDIAFAFLQIVGFAMDFLSTPSSRTMEQFWTVDWQK